MKNLFSFSACALVGLVLIQYRLSYTDVLAGKPLKITTWDAFGYYMYLPSSVIYNDMTELEWLPEMDSTYQLTGGELYQSNIHTNGNYVNKYLGGVSIMQAPFFFIGHSIAISSHYNADGFSPPYQYSIAFGAIFYCILALFILRNILLRYYSDHAVALSILLMVLATNLIQYISIDSAMSHAFIFPLYAFVLYATVKWHETPKLKWAMAIGLTIGLATISRPTELIMLFIPLLWGTQNKEASKAKWQLVKANRKHILFALLFGIIGIAPQLIYWKMTSGSFIYDVGSKWFFLNPFFRVLFGFENGWFIYTPITIFFVLGFFFLKKFPFRKSVIVFCLLNIWIVIAWSDWKYGATYSTRALVQSYPVFLLGFTGFVEWILTKKWKYPFFAVAGFLIYANLFQIWQYNTTVLHYRDMNRQYYASIYLDSSPTPLDMSLLDTDEILRDESSFKSKTLYSLKEQTSIEGDIGSPAIIAVENIGKSPTGWVKVEVTLEMEEGFAACSLHGKIELGDGHKETKIRFNNPISEADQINNYAFYMKIPECKASTNVKIFVNSWSSFRGELKSVKVTHLTPTKG